MSTKIEVDSYYKGKAKYSMIFNDRLPFSKPQKKTKKNKQ